MTKTTTKTETEKINPSGKMSLEDYHSLQYSVIITADENGGYVATIPDLEGCIAEGDTFEEAAKEIEEVRKIWLEEAFLADCQIPLPRKFSGTISLRMPPTLHQEVFLEAQHRGISLNSYLVNLITENNAYYKVISKVEQLSGNRHNDKTKNDRETSLEDLENGIGSLKAKESLKQEDCEAENIRD
jgi:antitoxin HicB